MEVIKIENGVKKLLIVASTEEDREWLKSLGVDLQIQIITEQGMSVLGQPITGSLLLSQSKIKQNER